MKIFFINPPNHPFTESSLLIEPIDTLVVASYIESLGNEVKYIDMDVKKMQIKDLNKYLERFQPDFTIIVFDYHIPLHNSTECIDDTVNIAKLAKKYKSKVIVGGKIATYKYNKLIYENSPIDICIGHDLEIPLKKLISCEHLDFEDLKKIQGISFFYQNNVYKTNSKEERLDLNTLPIVNRNLVDLSDYIDVRTVLSSKGCSMKCSFCHVPGFWGNWTGMNAEKIYVEIESLCKNHNAKKILFLDDNTTVNRERMRALAKKLIRSKLDIKLGCLGTINSFDLETMENMYQAGFRWIHYGCEYGDDEVLKKIKKHTNVEMIKKVVKDTHKIGFRIRTSWILDLPDTDINSLNKTIDVIQNINSEEIRLHFLSLRLGSALYDKYGNYDLTTQYIHHGNPNNYLTNISNEIFIEKIKELIKKLENKGYKIVYDAKDFADLDKLQVDNPKMKIVSLCPLQYGINW